MGVTTGTVILNCPGREALRFREGEPLQAVLALARQDFGPGHFTDSEGFVVTELSTLEAGCYEYLPAPADMCVPAYQLPAWTPLWLRSAVDLVMPTVPLPSRAAPQQEMGHYLVTPEVREAAERASFLIVGVSEVGGRSSKRKRQEMSQVGMGFFYTPTSALTCAHNLPEAALKLGQFIRALERDEASVNRCRDITLKVAEIDNERDWVKLTFASQHAFMPIYQGPAEKLLSAPLGLCSFHYSLSRQLASESDPDMLSHLGVMPGTGLQLSMNGRHILYSCDCWPGDSGDAVILFQGQVAAMHQEGINHVKELIRQKQDTNERLDALEQSLQSIIQSTSQGALGLLTASFPIN